MNRIPAMPGTWRCNAQVGNCFRSDVTTRRRSLLSIGLGGESRSLLSSMVPAVRKVSSPLKYATRATRCN